MQDRWTVVVRGSAACLFRAWLLLLPGCLHRSSISLQNHKRVQPRHHLQKHHNDKDPRLPGHPKHLHQQLQRYVRPPNHAHPLKRNILPYHKINPK